MSKNDIDWLKVIIQAHGLSETMSMFSAACCMLAGDQQYKDSPSVIELMSASVQLDALSVEYEEHDILLIQ